MNQRKKSHDNLGNMLNLVIMKIPRIKICKIVTEAVLTGKYCFKHTSRKNKAKNNSKISKRK